MLKNYMIMAYANLIRAERMVNEETEDDTRKVVPIEYREAVAEYLTK